MEENCRKSHVRVSLTLSAVTNRCFESERMKRKEREKRERKRLIEKEFCCWPQFNKHSPCSYSYYATHFSEESAVKWLNEFVLWLHVDCRHTYTSTLYFHLFFFQHFWLITEFECLLLAANIFSFSILILSLAYLVLFPNHSSGYRLYIRSIPIDCITKKYSWIVFCRRFLFILSVNLSNLRLLSAC